MGYFTGSGDLPPQANPRATTARARRTTVRTRHGSGDALGDIYSYFTSRFPSYAPPPTTQQTTTAIKLLSTAPTLPKIATSFIQPVTATPTTTAPIPSNFSPTGNTSVPLPVTAPPPPPSQPIDAPAPPPQQPANTGGGSSGAGAVAAAAAPIVGAIDPMAGAAAALLPAFANAANQPDTTQIRFSGDVSPLDAATMPDAGPEVYNADGTPVTPAAKAAAKTTIADKLKALPPAAKIGGAVALYLLFARR